jgi:hypothetical protein
MGPPTLKVPKRVLSTPILLAKVVERLPTGFVLVEKYTSKVAELTTPCIASKRSKEVIVNGPTGKTLEEYAC